MAVTGVHNGEPLSKLLPFLVVFLSSACVMVIELVASRLIAQYVGSNLFTWTSIIAVVLAGLTLGNLVGGILADRHRALGAGRMVATALIASGLLALASVAIVGPVFQSTLDSELLLPLRILLGVTIVFFVPAVVLGSISPLAATWAIQSDARLGTTVGRLYAVGSLGAIAGTLLTGFVLISWLGSITIMVLVAATLALASLMVHRTWSFALAALFVVVVSVVVGIGASGATPSVLTAIPGEMIYSRETRYQTVSVSWDPRRGVRTIVLDNLIHGFILPEEPRVLLYPYIGMYASSYEVLRNVHERPLTSLHLGGGAYTLPRFLVEAFPDDEVIVSEIDPGVTEASHAVARLERPPPFELLHEDARQVVRDLAGDGRRVDIVFADAYSSYSIPYHLATVEFYREVDAILSSGGLLLLNVIDDLSEPRMLSSIYATVKHVHPYVVVMRPSAYAAGEGRDTFIVMSSRESIDTVRFAESMSDANIAASIVDTSQLDGFDGGRAPLVLTDDFAPVERLVLHLFE